MAANEDSQPPDSEGLRPDAFQSNESSNIEAGLSNDDQAMASKDNRGYDEAEDTSVLERPVEEQPQAYEEQPLTYEEQPPAYEEQPQAHEEQPRAEEPAPHFEPPQYQEARMEAEPQAFNEQPRPYDDQPQTYQEEEPREDRPPMEAVQETFQTSQIHHERSLHNHNEGPPLEEPILSTAPDSFEEKFAKSSGTEGQNGDASPPVVQEFESAE